MLRDFRCGSNLKLSLAFMEFELNRVCIKRPEATKEKEQRD